MKKKRPRSSSIFLLASVFFLKFLAQESPFSSVQINTYPYICNMYVYMYLCRQTFIETEFHMCIKICVDYLLLFLHSIIFLLHVCVPHFLWVVNNTCYSRCWFVFFSVTHTLITIPLIIRTYVLSAIFSPIMC